MPRFLICYEIPHAGSRGQSIGHAFCTLKFFGQTELERIAEGILKECRQETPGINFGAIVFRSVTKLEDCGEAFEVSAEAPARGMFWKQRIKDPREDAAWQEKAWFHSPEDGHYYTDPEAAGAVDEVIVFGAKFVLFQPPKPKLAENQTLPPSQI